MNKNEFDLPAVDCMLMEFLQLTNALSLYLLFIFYIGGSPYFRLFSVREGNGALKLEQFHLG